MIGERTLYRKIQAVLDVSKKGTASSAEDLLDEIISNELINFLYKRLDKITDKEIAEQSVLSIKKTIDICMKLGLIRDNGTLTSLGIKALSLSDYDKVLGKLIIKFLEENGISIIDIERKINILLHSKPYVLPTSKNLWESIKPSIGLEEFSQMFTLLAHCRHIISARNKIYLGFHK